ncbi:hypothetical protein EDB84DRAFT_1442599, partial [Lactarius hengduanensis]
MPAASKKMMLTLALTTKRKGKASASAKRRTQGEKLAHKKQKQRVEASSDEEASVEEIRWPCRKRSKLAADSEDEADSDTSDSDPEGVEVDSSRNESSPDTEGDGLEDRHRLTVTETINSKKDMTQDLRLIFGDRVVVKFMTGSEVKTLTGRWCNVC